MKNNTLNHHRQIGLEIPDKNFDYQSPYSEKKIDEIFPFCLAGNYSYSGPLPMIDVKPFFDEFKKNLKEWLAAINIIINTKKVRFRWLR
ncbi:hypothetical protein [Flavobacterium sp. B17]|uniref:hypothetical protein n=1 Tax=Flavobacterium sp. B17 TaxID=95618 RepID=UPI0005B29FE4|nr:hypothetical protein [Flavobacterium sp. B17]